MKLNQVTVGCLDYDKSAAFYRMLGLTQIVDSPPRYARFETPSGETFSIHAAQEIGAPSTMIYFECDELDETVAALEAKGIAFDSPPATQDWLWREARLSDPAGNPLCLFHADDNRRFPPWRIDGRGSDQDNEEGKEQ